MVKINSAFLQNITENLPALSQAEIGHLSARAVYRIARSPEIEQQECAAKVYELSERAIKWFERSAEKNNVVAVCALGYIFSRNEDYDKAVMWFEKGAALGSQLAAEELEALRPLVTQGSATTSG
ncbi:MAG: hypothetical protein ACK5MA_06220 [Parachlamydiaceae bacterium]